MTNNIKDQKKVGTPLSELQQVLPALSRGQIQVLIRNLVREDKIYHIGERRAAKWFPKEKSQ